MPEEQIETTSPPDNRPKPGRRFQLAAAFSALLLVAAAAWVWFSREEKLPAGPISQTGSQPEQEEPAPAENPENIKAYWSRCFEFAIPARFQVESESCYPENSGDGLGGVGQVMLSHGQNLYYAASISRLPSARSQQELFDRVEGEYAQAKHLPQDRLTRTVIGGLEAVVVYLGLLEQDGDARAESLTATFLDSNNYEYTIRLTLLPKSPSRPDLESDFNVLVSGFRPGQ